MVKQEDSRQYIYFFYCLAREFPIVSRNLSLHGKFGHAEAGAFILSQTTARGTEMARVFVKQKSGKGYRFKAMAIISTSTKLFMPEINQGKA